MAQGPAFASAVAPTTHVSQVNSIVFEELQRRLDTNVPCAEAVDIRISDFDDVRIRLEVSADASHLVHVAINVPGFDRSSVEEHLQRVYGRLLDAQPSADADVSVTVDTSDLRGDAPLEVAHRVASLRAHIACAPFLRLMAGVAAGEGGRLSPCVVLTRPLEPVYLLPRSDKLLVVFRLELPEGTDRALARLVVQELVDPGQGRAVSNAPSVTWSEREPPAELRGFPGALPPLTQASLGYVTFTLLSQGHLKTEGQRQAVAAHLSTFRTYLTFHLVAAKSNLHARMRGGAEKLQQVLNRAIPDNPLAERSKKLASGREFVRKV